MLYVYSDIFGIFLFVEIQARENLYDVSLRDESLIHSIPPAYPSPVAPVTWNLFQMQVGLAGE